MSANNWTVCPRCAQVGKSWRQVMGEELEDADLTLREDYEQGMDAKGNYVVIYGCSCEVCGFRWSYHHETNVLKT